MSDKQIMEHVVYSAMQQAEELLKTHGVCNLKTTQGASGYTLRVYNVSDSFTFKYEVATGEVTILGESLQKDTDKFNTWLNTTKGIFIKGLSQFSDYLVANKGRSSVTELLIGYTLEDGVKLLSTRAVIINTVLDFPAYVTLYEDTTKGRLKGQLEVGKLVIANNVTTPFKKLNSLLVTN